MNWFKLTLDKSGAILTCEQVDAAEKNGTLTCYIQATTKVEACSDAKKWYQNRSCLRAASNRKGREARRLAGLCVDCGNSPVLKKRKTCDRCVNRRRQRRDDIKNGIRAVRAPLSPEQALAAQKASAARWGKRRISASTVLEILDRAGPDALRRWLVELIEKGEAAPPF